MLPKKTTKMIKPKSAIPYKAKSLTENLILWQTTIEETAQIAPPKSYEWASSE
jgi:hypothetical protein